MRRGHTILEVVAATALALVVIPSLFPRTDAQLIELRSRFERETVRLILEGELERARLEGEQSLLVPGSAAVPLESYGSAQGVADLQVTRQVRRTPPGLLTVRVEARWRPALPAPGQGGSLALSTWVVAR